MRAPALAQVTGGPRHGGITGDDMAGTKRQAASGQNERMSAVDTAWLRMDETDNAMMIVTVMTSATPIPTPACAASSRPACCVSALSPARRSRPARRFVARGRALRPGRAFRRRPVARQGRSPRIAAARRRTGKPSPRSRAPSVATALHRALRSWQCLGAPAAPLLCRRHRHGAGLDVAHRTGCGPGARGCADEPVGDATPVAATRRRQTRCACSTG